MSGSSDECGGLAKHDSRWLARDQDRQVIEVRFGGVDDRQAAARVQR